MFQRKQRRFRRRRNGRNNMPHGNGHMQTRSGSNMFSNQTRNNFRNIQSAEKLLEKYNLLAKEAMSSGDKTSCENYLQHADHFSRIIEDKNKNKEQIKVNNTDKPVVEEKKLPENEETKQEDITKNKE